MPIFKNMKNRGSLFLLGGVILSLGACSSPPKKIDMLEQARTEYASASKDVATAKYAPELLDQARDALQDADTRWKAKDETWRVEHFAYIAKQRVETARLVSESKQTESEVQALLGDRSKLSLQLREAELKRVRDESIKQKQMAEEENRALKQQMAEEARELKEQLAALQAKETERGMVLTLGDVLFDSGKATLTSGSNRNISKIAAFMAKYPERVAVIEGHTDSMGDDNFNIQLSRKRALSVRDALVNAGVRESRMSVNGLGESLPVDSNDTAAGRQANRRVEVIFPDTPTRTSVQISEADEN